MESFTHKRSLCRYLDPALQEILDSNPFAPQKQEIWILFDIFGNNDLTRGQNINLAGSSAGYASGFRYEGCVFKARCPQGKPPNLKIF